MSCCRQSEELLTHEAIGHGFAKLADEYVRSTEGSATEDDIKLLQQLHKKWSWYLNVDSEKDSTKVLWSKFIIDSEFANEKIGTYEGGYTFFKGVYRPSENSMMNQNIDYYNAPSRWAIYQRIMKLSGESCSFDKFLQYDAVNRGAKQAHAPVTRPGNGWVPGSAPVITR